MILDTCALLWLVQGGGPLSADTRQRLDSAPVLYVSAISGFEIGVKHQKGKLRLPLSPTDWFEAVLEYHDLQILAINLAICLRSTRLPAVHADPCDRMIIATAQEHHLAVVTADSVFAKYDIEVLV